MHYAFRIASAALLLATACQCQKEEVRPRFAITAAGDGPAASLPLLPLRPGYTALGPALESRTAFVVATRTTEVAGGDGVVFQFGLTGENLRAFDLVLDETEDGVVARVAGGQILNPPWVIIPANPREGMAWEIYDEARHVLARGSLSRGDPVAWPATVDPEAPPVAELLRPWVLHFDTARAGVDTPEGLAQGHLTIEDWERPIRRPGLRSPAAFQPHFREFNPISPTGAPTAWTLIEGEGFSARAALIPSETIVTSALPMQDIRPLDLGDLGQQLANRHPWSITAIRKDPRDPASSTQVVLWSTALEAVPPENFFMEWQSAQQCPRFAPGTWQPQGLDGINLRPCVDATHFEVSSGGVATAPTRFGLTPFTPVLPRRRPDGLLTRDFSLVGGIQGLHRASDGSVRGLAHAPDRAALTHVGEVLPDGAREASTDEHVPFVGSTIVRPITLDEFAGRVGEPVVGDVVRTIALRPEGPDGVPLILDAWPHLGHGMLRAAPEGSPATAYLPDFESDLLLPDPVTVTYDGEGQRSVTVSVAHGGVYELDVTSAGLRWRSLGRPNLPDRHSLVGAWREGAQVVLITREGIVATGAFEGIPAYTTSELASWTMPVVEGAWEPLPTHLYAGVDVLGRTPDRPRRSDEADAPLALDRVICAPPGQTVDGAQFDGRATEVVPTDERCALVLRAGAPAVLDAVTAVTPEPATLRFHRSDLGNVIVRGRESFTPLGGRHVVPRARWEALSRPGLPTAEGTHYASLAAPFPTNDVFPGSPGVIPDPAGAGHWVVHYDTLATCGPFASPPEPCFSLQYVPESGPPRRYTVPAWYADVDPDDPLEPWQSSREPSARILPAADLGLYVSVIQAGATAPMSWVGPDGVVAIGDACGEEGDTAGAPTSPEGTRPAFRVSPNGACATAAGDLFPRGTANDSLTNVPEPPPGSREALSGLRDPWRGVFRTNSLDDAAVRFLERFGGPVSTIDASVGLPLIQDFDRHRRQLLVLHPHAETATPWLLYATDSFGRPVERIAAGVAAPLRRSDDDLSKLHTGLRPLDLPFLPHEHLRRPRAGCDPETEVALENGRCDCAWEHERVGSRCQPIFGGSYLPAPSCAAIAERAGSAPPFAYIDPDGTTGLENPRNAATTGRMACRADGLTELAPDPRWGNPPALWDTPIVGDFELRFEATAAPGIWLGLYEAPWSPVVNQADRSTWAETPIVALTGDNGSRRDLPQRLLFRVRTETVDLGPVVDGAYSLTRQGDLLMLRRGSTLLHSRAFDVSPLFVDGAPTLGRWMQGTLAFAGPRCLPRGRDHGAGLCVLEPQTCVQRGHTCGNGDDGAFGRLECGPPPAGTTCSFGRYQ